MLTREQKIWRYKIFAVTWLAYAGFYFCRKNFSVNMHLIADSLGYSKDNLAVVITGYSLLYMLGQFLNGYLSDKYGPRVIVGIGILVAVLTNFLMGSAGSVGMFLFLMSLNGFGQSSGWPGFMKNMSSWFTRKERGVVMSWWSTCYVIGAAAATVFATYWATNQTFFAEYGWKRGFWAPAIVLLIFGVIFVVVARNTPKEAGVDGDFVSEDDPVVDSQTAEIQKRRLLRSILGNSAVWVSAAMYFFVKLTRYAFLFWLPYYMQEALKYSSDTAGYTSSIYELAGFGGVLIAGYLSDRVFGSRRFPVGALMLFGLALSCFLQAQIATLGWYANAIGIGLIGVMTYGPDALMSGAGAMDLGGRDGAATAAGIINGVGSAGQLLSPFIVAIVSDRFGWNSLFYLFVVMALIAAVLLLTKWNYGKPVWPVPEPVPAVQGAEKQV